MDGTAQNPQQPNTTQPVVPQQLPVYPIGQPQGGAGGRPEAPVGSGMPPREATPIDNAEAVTTATDDNASVPDQVSDALAVQTKESADITMQEAHPQVEIGQELKDAGIEQGKDADSSQREEEQLKTEPVVQPDTQSSASGISLASDPVRIEEVKKKSGIREAIKWLAASLIRQLKKMNMRPEDQKTTW